MSRHIVHFGAKFAINGKGNLQDFLDAQPLTNPERLMMASEMDMDEDEQEVMAIVASDLNMKIGAKVNYM